MAAFVRERPGSAPESGWQALCESCGEFWQIRPDMARSITDAEAHNERLHDGEAVKVIDALGQTLVIRSSVVTDVEDWYLYASESRWREWMRRARRLLAGS